MHAKRLPTILDLMIAEAGANGLSPVYECKSGWCTQCSCKKEDVERLYGQVSYRSEPVIPTTKDKILPCISTQTKFSERLEDLINFAVNPNVEVIRKSVILARAPASNELGTQLKTLVVSNGKLIVGNRAVIEPDSVIVRNPVALSQGKYSDMLVSREKFFDTYGAYPGDEFTTFASAKPVLAYKITPDIANSWRKDPDGKMYFSSGKDTYLVDVGTIITVNGTAITDAIANRIELRVLTDKVEKLSHSIPQVNPHEKAVGL